MGGKSCRTREVWFAGRSAVVGVRSGDSHSSDQLAEAVAFSLFGFLQLELRFRQGQQPAAKATQPTINATPPKGVIIPNQRSPVKASTYRLPENSRIPRVNEMAATDRLGQGFWRSKGPLGSHASE